MSKKLLYLMIALITLTSSAFFLSFQFNTPKINGAINIWLTTTNQKNLLTSQKPIYPNTKNKKTANNTVTIKVNPNKTYQKMDGFGASLTDASAWLIGKTLTDKQRDKIMAMLFSPNTGIGISFVRQPMGASDYAKNLYTYDDVSGTDTDYSLEKFSIDHDNDYIIPLIKEALKLNPSIKIMASPWSPPAWMKTSGNLIGGSLLHDCYDVYSRYFVKFIKGYKAAGIPIYAVSVQNEPLYVPTEYPGMKMDAEDEADFISKYLGPQFEKNKLSTKIIGYDHNWDNTAYANTLLTLAGKYVSGTAWHCYGGKPEAMSDVHSAFPDKDIWFTEASGGSWVPPFDAAFSDQIGHIIHATRNYAKTIVWWNIALDQNNGPTVLKNSTCRGLIKVDTSTGDITYNLDYYTMGHISKFVKPGAYRIDSDNYNNNIETTAFKNPDSSIVLIAHNTTGEDKLLEITYGTSTFNYLLPGKAAATFKWK